ncbi:hypothetical protein AN478_13370 [Thiohalorhabdus denitrificans]|uniref:Probable inorganic carbon transporter subunit DabA n=1 Tax=Thiohalorhabdus denitrificans TaxID=381306 RepID=A0A0P9C3F5_9GAMM|nr:DUF2309 domain-containing protein [Thiohalorhabdus denitrificans]KPV39251.1 hypothetical protein AN478_13370 [Thiohalorhabdus denitrificans]SCX74853.1 hypothetical protein SAMN05661077_0175 [Thiohalorhabdus denitrificans]
MSLSLGEELKIRTTVYVAGEPIPFFWPMRSFIHHNPLHGLEHLPFPEAVEKGEELFHARGYLPRCQYQRYLTAGQVDRERLAAEAKAFAAERDPIPGIDLPRWLMALLTEVEQPVARTRTLAGPEDVKATLNGSAPTADAGPVTAAITDGLRAALLGERPVYEAVDALYGTEIGAELDELVIKSCLDFFDEGQSVWGMPGREQGFFAAWRQLAVRNGRFSLRGLHVERILAQADGPEEVIAQVMRTLEVPESRWMGYFTRELVRLHGWAGFIRWRSHARHYHWNQRYPGDLVDLLAVRLTLALALLSERKHRDLATTAGAIEQAIENRPRETYLRHELHSGAILPAQAAGVEKALARGKPDRIERIYADYVRAKRDQEAHRQAERLQALATRAGEAPALDQLSGEALERLLDTLHAFERHEGMLWLRAMEAQATDRLLRDLNPTPPAPREKRPFAQALFCIDTRSERIRRHLEAAGDYQTYGIAGFFGVPISFMELGKGSETPLCPVLLTPKNLVPEMPVSAPQDPAAVTALEKALHELKESIVSPFVTVEAIGLLFGLDMVGKTLIPRQYNRWRQHLHEDKPPARMLLDKLSREQADSIVRTVQRAVIIQAVGQEFGLQTERITDAMVRELREAAMGKQHRAPELAQSLGLDAQGEQAFIKRLREVYRIDPAFARLQMERLGRIGFSLDEQVGFVGNALRAIGLTEGFSRFILLVGHGSTSENNPYESALDCGACGGNHGLVNARVLAQMANKPEVRDALREQGIDIPDDAWFMAALHDTTTDELRLSDLDRMPASHVAYLDRLHNGLRAASRRCAQERIPTLQITAVEGEPGDSHREAQRNSMDWSQVRPEWGLSGNAYFIIGRRALTQELALDGRAFLHSYDYRIDPKRRLLETILTGPLVVGQWINMEHYFSTVDNERFGSGSKVYHNVAGRLGVMTGNLSDLRTGLPSQTVLDQGRPYHQPLRLITVIEAPLAQAQAAVENVVSVKHLVRNGWIRLLVIDPETGTVTTYDDGQWLHQPLVHAQPTPEEAMQHA